MYVWMLEACTSDFYRRPPGSLEPLSIIAVIIIQPKYGCYLTFGRFCTSHIVYSSFWVFYDRLSPPLNVHTLLWSALPPFEALRRLSVCGCWRHCTADFHCRAPVCMCLDAGGMHGGLTVRRLARYSLCSVIAIIINLRPPKYVASYVCTVCICMNVSISSLSRINNSTLHVMNGSTP